MYFREKSGSETVYELLQHCGSAHQRLPAGWTLWPRHPRHPRHPLPAAPTHNVAVGALEYFPGPQRRLETDRTVWDLHPAAHLHPLSLDVPCVFNNLVPKSSHGEQLLHCLLLVVEVPHEETLHHGPLHAGEHLLEGGDQQVATILRVGGGILRRVSGGVGHVLHLNHGVRGGVGRLVHLVHQLREASPSSVLVDPLTCRLSKYLYSGLRKLSF